MPIHQSLKLILTLRPPSTLNDVRDILGNTPKKMPSLILRFLAGSACVVVAFNTAVLGAPPLITVPPAAVTIVAEGASFRLSAGGGKRG